MYQDSVCEHTYTYTCAAVQSRTLDKRETQSIIDTTLGDPMVCCLPLRVAGGACVTTWQNNGTQATVVSRSPVQQLCMAFPLTAFVGQRVTSQVLQITHPRSYRVAPQLPPPTPTDYFWRPHAVWKQPLAVQQNRIKIRNSTRESPSRAP